MRQEIAFNAEGIALRGWLYLPDRAAGPVPTVVMAHGFSAVKEMYLDAFAQVFAQAGLGALVFDDRNFGASDGEPRQESILGNSCETTGMPSPTLVRCPRSMRRALGSGDPVTVAATSL